MTAAGSELSRVTAVIVNYNSGRWLARCIENLRGRGGTTPDVIVIDNASEDGSTDVLPALPAITLRRAHRNLGFGRGVNQALRSVRTDYLLIINPDCLLVPASLARLVEELDRNPDVALVSGRVFDMRGVEQRGSRRRLPTRRQVLSEVLPFSHVNGIDLTHEPSPDEPADVEAVSGACMLVRTAALEQVGGFDPRFHMHFEDLDMMARLREAGWRIRLVPSVFVSHAGGVSSRRRPVAVMWAKHKSLWRYLNKHCSDDWTWFSRAMWWLLIHLHGVIMTPVYLVTQR
ncbi:glycosyltransferase family 2 protein [Wenzhouxiangella sp. EGI_FJ10305]|uniref:glycosyltransferase family 2 protein n=1 Tax=Wenzhouxiangella sp. EGI_FJ10305 TaxID=3243768 RepID=UPI0035D69BA3